MICNIWKKRKHVAQRKSVKVGEVRAQVSIKRGNSKEMGMLLLGSMKKLLSVQFEVRTLGAVD